MKTIDSGKLADIGDGLYIRGDGILFDFPSGLHGFWKGVGPLTVSGVLYNGAGSLLEVEALNSGVDLSASAISVKLRAIPETALSGDVLATIEDESYKGRPVIITRFYFRRDTGVMTLALVLWRGYVDNIDHNRTVGADYTLVAHLEPRSIDHSRQGFRVRGDADQRLIDPADAFYEHAATTPTEILPYGRASTATAASTGGALPQASS